MQFIPVLFKGQLYFQLSIGFGVQSCLSVLGKLLQGPLQIQKWVKFKFLTYDKVG